MKQLILTLFVLFARFWANAQEPVTNAAREATGLRAGNKIYVVMVVTVTILIGLLLYVIRLDRKISKLEKQN
jgi:uncharacterized membrane protein